MKLYLSYLLLAVLTFVMITILYSVSAGFANFVPILALLGAVVLFAFIGPILFYKVGLGLIVGLAGCLLMLPFHIMFLNGVLEDKILNWVVLLILLPSAILLFSIYLTLKCVIKGNGVLSDIPKNVVIRTFLAWTPAVLLVIYLLLYGKYWSWEMFRI